MGFIQEFKAFALKGNLVDMAVAFVMGAAFVKVSDSFVQGVFTPPIGLLTQEMDFKGLKTVLRHKVPAVLDAAGKEIQPAVAEVAIAWGEFINASLNFLIVAFAMFLVVKGMNALKKKEEVTPSAPPVPTKEEVLLTEIRDALRNK